MSKGTTFLVIIAICGAVSFLFGISAVWTDLMDLNSSSSENEIWFVFFPLLLFIIFGVFVGMIFGSLFLLGIIPLIGDFTVFLIRALTWDIQIITAILGSDTKSKDQEETAKEVNLIAATEIARQLRLRDMGGIIVVDFIDLASSQNRRDLFEHLKKEMSHDRTKHKILPPSKFGLIQITRQRVRPVMTINTKELNPNKNNVVEAPIVLLEKISSDLDKIINNNKHKKKKIFLHIHSFIAAYLNQGFPSIKTKWFIKYKRRIRVIPRDSYFYLKYKFLDENKKRIFI